MNYATEEQFNALIQAHKDAMKARDERLDYLYSELRLVQGENTMLREKVAELQELLKRRFGHE